MEAGAFPSSAEARGDLTARFRRTNQKSRWWNFNFDRENIDEFCERGVLGAVLAMLVWGPIANGSTRPSQFLVLLGLGVLMLGFWAVRVCVRQQYRFLFPPFSWAVIAFTGYAIWRYSWADIEYGARLELMQIILYAAVFFAVMDNLTKSESIQILLFAMIGLAMLNAFYAVFQYFSDSQKVLWFDKPTSYRGRGSGTYICPNHFVGFMEMVLPVALAYTITGRFKPLTKVFLGYAGLTMLAGVGVSISRGGYVAVGLSLIVFFVILLWNRDYRIPALAVLILLLAGGSMFGFRSWQTQKRFDSLQYTNIRFKYWEAASQIWKNDFWFGTGPHSYNWRFRPYRFWHLQGQPVYAHNDYLNTLAEYGTTGGIIIGTSLLLLGWGVVRSWKYVRRSSDIGSKPSNRSATVLGCSVGLLAIAIHSGTDFNLHIPANALIAVILMAILSSHIRYATERFWVNPKLFGRVFVMIALLCAGAYMSMEGLKVARQTWVMSGYSNKLPVEQRLAILQRAHEIDPKNGVVTFEMGEVLRQSAWKSSDDNAEKRIREAMPWFEKGIQLNKWNPFNYIHLGMCHHWLKERDKATPLFEKALALDPNGYHVLGMYGWHKLELGDLETALKYFQQSTKYGWEQDHRFAKGYVEIIERRLAEKPPGG